MGNWEWRINNYHWVKWLLILNWCQCIRSALASKLFIILASCLRNSFQRFSTFSLDEKIGFSAAIRAHNRSDPLVERYLDLIGEWLKTNQAKGIESHHGWKGQTSPPETVALMMTMQTDTDLVFSSNHRSAARCASLGHVRSRQCWSGPGTAVSEANKLSAAQCASAPRCMLKAKSNEPGKRNERSE